MAKRGYVYILASRKHGTLYTGVTSNLSARVYQHKQGVGWVKRSADPPQSCDRIGVGSSLPFHPTYRLPPRGYRFGSRSKVGRPSGI